MIKVRIGQENTAILNLYALRNSCKTCGAKLTKLERGNRLTSVVGTSTLLCLQLIEQLDSKEQGNKIAQQHRQPAESK